MYTYMEILYIYISLSLWPYVINPKKQINHRSPKPKAPSDASAAFEEGLALGPGSD